MAKQWSMDEIDDLLENTQDDVVSDLFSEFLGTDSAAAEAPAEEEEPAEDESVSEEEAAAVEETPEPEPEEDFEDEDDGYSDEDDFDEDEGPDVEGVEDLLERPGKEPEEELPEAPAAEAPVEEAPVEEAEAEVPSEEPGDETDYVPGFVDDIDAAEEEGEPGKPSFLSKLKAFRESFINVVEGSESDEGFTDEDYGLAPAPQDGVQRMTGREKFMDRDMASQKTKVFDPLAEDTPAAPRDVDEVRNKGALFKGIDENAGSPKMIMELADDKPQQPEEKKALAQKTVGIRPIRNENIEHQILTTK